MSWKDILKMHCGGNREKADEDDNEEEKVLYGNQKRIDKDKDGKITGKDFAMLRREKINKRELKEGGITISHDECKDMERKILAEVKKEGGALGMKNLKGIGSPKKLKMVLADMKKRGTIHEHTNGDFYTHKPKR
tara:strand:+ start:87 stop:491 length:405 start_codon:yes stop_codon:yes gene_type:complete